METGQRLRSASNTFSLFSVAADTLASMTQGSVGVFALWDGNLALTFKAYSVLNTNI